MELFPATDIEIFTRLIVAVILGLLLGIERSRVGKHAGMRTYALVSLGSALFVVISTVASQQFIGEFSFDPLRVASQIVVGIGFIGAGVIFLHNDRLSGLTTAAGLWVAAGLGVAAGFGLFEIAFFVAFMTLFIFEILWFIEDRFVRQAKKIKYEEEAD